MTGLDFAFFILAQPGTSGYVVHIGTYRSETEAYRAQHQLEQSDPHYFMHIAFSVTRYTGVTRRSPALFLSRLPRITSPIYAPFYGTKNRMQCQLHTIGQHAACRAFNLPNAVISDL